MRAPVTLPLWLVLLLAALAAWGALDRLLVPSVRWFLRSRADRVLREVRDRFQIDIRPFQLTKRQVLIDRLVYDAKVLESAQQTAEREGMPREVAMERVERYAREIVPAFNAYFYFRLGYWLARRVARLLYRVRLTSSDEAGLAAIPRDASVVFVINHRSNMDYILVSYLVATRTALSYAVGEWARIWPLESLLKAMGAYFVRRRSRDELYRRVLERYVQMATEAGVPQALFPEGALSRDGRLQDPRLGLLGYMLDTFDPSGPRDLVFVPVAVNYDRTLEDRTLLLDLDLDAPRPSPLRAFVITLGFMVRQLRLMARGGWHRFGYACVSLGTPVSMRRWLADRRLDLRALPRQERFAQVAGLAGDLMAEIGREIPVVPVSLVAAVMVEQGGAPVTELELETEVWRLMKRLEERGARLHLPRDSRKYAVEVGVRMLLLRRALVETAPGMLRAAPGEERLLAYYAGSIDHLLTPRVQGADAPATRGEGRRS